MYKVDFEKPIHVYFMGIGGISMSGLAEILLQEGFTVSGSDMKESEITEILKNLGARIFIGQKVRIRVDALGDKTFHGTVTAISEATGSKYSLVPTDNSAGNFVKVQQRIPVRIDFDDVSPEEMQLLRAGMMVETEAKIR